ncbi:MAG TPA: hypothetical protein DEP68_00620, partial [Erythrobacter sp.]|nr:hypothetical protein [Erythrobacter sp.]
TCADELDDICPNCKGELMDRPTRPKRLHDKYPPTILRAQGTSTGAG